MLANIPPEITIGSFSIVGVLTGYIWNLQGKKIDEIIEIQKKRPCNTICSHIESIEVNIEWIKEELKNKK